MVWAILSTILCCLPFGIVAIIYANKVDTLWFTGQYEAAEAAAKSAKTWTIAAAGTGLGVVLLYILFVAIVAIASL